MADLAALTPTEALAERWRDRAREARRLAMECPGHLRAATAFFAAAEECERIATALTGKRGGRE